MCATTGITMMLKLQIIPKYEKIDKTLVNSPSD